MQDLRVTIVQTDIHWEDKEANWSNLASKFNMAGETDLIIIPETFNAGFTMSAKCVAEIMNGPSVLWMLEQSNKHDCVVCGSLVIKEEGNYYNRIVWAKPDGTTEHYDKRHLFTMADEHKHYAGGKHRKIVELNGWRINLQVCYDLRFPVFSRNRNDYDLLLYVANWPEPRRNAWSTLLLARAIENQCYTVGVNRIGEDGNGFTYSGDSVVVEPKGSVISSTKPYIDSVETVTLSWSELAEYRKKFPVGNDADEFELT